MSLRLKKASNWSRARALNRIDFAQPSPAPSTSPYEKPPHAAKPLKSARLARPAIISLMCTSTAVKPARSNAAAISIWPLTPCSRRMAMRGRAPLAIRGAPMFCAGSNVRRSEMPGSAASSMRSYSCSAHCGLSRSDCMRHVVSDHARCRSMRDSRKISRSPERTRNAASLVTTPMRSQRAPVVCNARSTTASSRARTCNTTPSSSLNSVSMAAASRMSSSTTPHRPANIISHTVANKPPSERSW